MRYWLDTEFIEDGYTIDPVSIGIVAEDGRTYYAEFHEADHSKADDWVKDNVLAHLQWGVAMKYTSVIAKEIVDFVGEDPEFWAYYADYDWVLLCQLYGRMIDLPGTFPMYCRDFKQWADEHTERNPSLPDFTKYPQPQVEHHALADAIWLRDAHLAAEKELDERLAKIVSREATLLGEHVLRALHTGPVESPVPVGPMRGYTSDRVIYDEMSDVPSGAQFWLDTSNPAKTRYVVNPNDIPAPETGPAYPRQDSTWSASSAGQIPFSPITTSEAIAQDWLNRIDDTDSIVDINILLATFGSERQWMVLRGIHDRVREAILKRQEQILANICG